MFIFLLLFFIFLLFDVSDSLWILVCGGVYFMVGDFFMVGGFFKVGGDFFMVGGKEFLDNGEEFMDGSFFFFGDVVSFLCVGGEEFLGCGFECIFFMSDVWSLGFSGVVMYGVMGYV